MIRFLLLHAKGDDDQEIHRQVEEARPLVAGFLGKPFEIVTGRDHFDRRFKSAGSWDAWATEAGGGIDHLTREPLFHGFLVPSEFVGNGTARIIGTALAVRKPVLAFGPGGIARVRWVQRADPKDWKRGWALGVSTYRLPPGLEVSRA